MILSLGSRDNLGNKQTKLRHNYLIKNERYVVITPHRQETGYTRSKKNKQEKKQLKQNKIKLLNEDFSNHQTQFRNPTALQYKKLRT